MNKHGRYTLACVFGLLLIFGHVEAQDPPANDAGSQANIGGQQQGGAGQPMESEDQQADSAETQPGAEPEQPSACGIEEVNDDLLPARYVTTEDAILFQSQQETFARIAACIAAPIGADEDRAKHNEIRERILLLTDLKKLLNRRTADIAAVAMLEGVDRQQLDQLKANLETETGKLDGALFALYEQIHSLDSLRELSGDDAIGVCSSGYSGFTDFKISELPDPNKLKEFLGICRTAFAFAVQTNDADALAALRAAAQASIDGINTAMVIHVDSAGTNFKRTDYRDAQNAIDTLQRLQGRESRLPLLANWQSDPFTYQFYTGVDISKVTGIDTNESVRLGLINYFRPGRQLQRLREAVPTCKNDQLICGKPGLYFPHAYMALNIASGEEQVSGENEPSIEWEGGLFVPVYIGRRGLDSNNITEIMFGPIVTRGGAQVGDTDDSNYRKYRGFRLAFNEETFFDGLYGSSDDFEGDRYVIRGQFPFTKLGGGRVFFGWDINFSAEGSGDPDDRDIVGFYAVWQTSFDDLWRSRTSGD